MIGNLEDSKHIKRYIFHFQDIFPIFHYIFLYLSITNREEIYILKTCFLGLYSLAGYLHDMVNN